VSPKASCQLHTALQQQVDQAAPGIFSGLPAAVWEQQPKLSRRRNSEVAVPPATVQQQQQLASPPAAAAPRRGADKQPTKRARVSHLDVATARAQEGMPAEAASKAAGELLRVWCQVWWAEHCAGIRGRVAGIGWPSAGRSAVLTALPCAVPCCHLRLAPPPLQRRTLRPCQSSSNGTGRQRRRQVKV
jgi:hypothetical protein